MYVFYNNLFLNPHATLFSILESKGRKRSKDHLAPYTGPVNEFIKIVSDLEI